MVLVRVEGGGHTWPNGAQYLDKRWIAPVCRDFGTELIWEFFKSHPRRRTGQGATSENEISASESDYWQPR